MRKIPPLAAHWETGTLGVCHLPRLWMKMLLAAKDALAEGYSSRGVGFDGLVIEGLGLDKERTLGHLTAQMPTYPAFEAWVLHELGGAVPDEKRQAINDRILHFEASPERRAELLAAAGVKDDGAWTRVVDINRWDDYGEFHRSVCGEQAGSGAMDKVPPLPANAERGMLGIVMLPRLWAKALLDAKGLLPEGYVATNHGANRRLMEELHLDPEETLGHIRRELPTYPAFEAWVLARVGGSVAAETRAIIDESILNREPPPERRAELLYAAGVADDGTWTKAVAINRFDDYGEFHRHLVGPEA